MPARKKNWSVYIARCRDGSLYTGISNDVDARIETHNAGKGAKYTRGRLPVRLVYSEVHISQGDALRREMEIKSLSADQKRQLFKQ